MEQTILQIIPAKKGTSALYVNGIHKYHAPIIAWALVSDNTAPQLKGMTALGGAVCSFADADPNFSRYVHGLNSSTVSMHPDLLARTKPEALPSY